MNFFFSLSSPPPRRLIIREDRCWMPTLSHMARVCRGAAGSILPHTLDGKKKKRKSRVSKSPPFIHWLVILLHYILFLPASMILLLLFPFSFFLFFDLRSSLLPVPQSFFFLRELPPPRGSLLAEQVYSGSLVVRLIHRHRSVGWGGPNTIDERMTPVYSIY